MPPEKVLKFSAKMPPMGALATVAEIRPLLLTPPAKVEPLKMRMPALLWPITEIVPLLVMPPAKFAT